MEQFAIYDEDDEEHILREEEEESETQYDLDSWMEEEETVWNELELKKYEYPSTS
jgi:hypothetical protein